MNNKITILLRKAIMSDAEEIYKIMQKALTALEDKSLFVCDDLDYVKKHIEETAFQRKELRAWLDKEYLNLIKVESFEN